jgi:BclB C-terminal domain-containing protein
MKKQRSVKDVLMIFKFHILLFFSFPIIKGTTGATGSSAIIPFSSGGPVVLTGLVGNLIGTTSLVGFGGNFGGVSLVGGNINLIGGSGIASNFAFVVPRNGTITSLSAFFSVVIGLSLLTPINITAQLFASATPNSNTFSPVAGGIVNMTLPGIISVGDTVSATTTGLNIPVTQGTRLLMVFSATSALAVALTGYASSGLAIN